MSRHRHRKKRPISTMDSIAAWEGWKTVTPSEACAVARGFLKLWMVQGDEESIQFYLKTLSDLGAPTEIQPGDSELIRSVFSRFPDTILASDAVTLITNMVDAIIGWFSSLFTSGVNLIESLKTSILEKFTQIASDAISAATEFFEGVIAFYQQLFEEGPQLIEDLKASVVEKFIALKEEAFRLVAEFVEIGKNIVGGIKAGLEEAWGGLQGLFEGLVKMLPEWARTLLGVESPSTVFIEIGMAIGEGLAEGIRASTPDVREAVEEMLDIAGSLGSIGSGAASLLKSRTLEPLQEQIDTLEDWIDSLEESLSEEFEDFLDGRPLTSLDIWPMEAIAMTEGNEEILHQIETLEKYWTMLSQAQIEYRQEQEKILALEKQQADLAFLQQQLDLLNLIKEQGLDAGSILKGLELGLEADAGGVVQAMTRAMQVMIEQAEATLGIASPSAVFARIGGYIMSGLAEGIAGSMFGPRSALQEAEQAMVDAFTGRNRLPAMGRGQGGQMNVTYNQNLTVYSNSQDERVADSFGLMTSWAKA